MAVSKLVLRSLFAYLFSLSLLLCGCGCKNEEPTVILQNHGTAKASIQIKTSNGNTENINNVDPGWKSEKRDFAAGDIEFTVTIQGIVEPVVYQLKVEDCTDYIVMVNPDNTISSTRDER
jgi:hypothetical protein